MKLHIPVLLRKALLACFAVGTLYSGGTTSAANLTLGSEDTLSINYSESDSIPDLENGTLQLNGDTLLHLAECGEGNGKTYTLLTGVSGLLDKDGNAITLDSSNNAASLYFDTSQPGTGFWADATLSLTEDGTLQLVRHHETVKAAQTITTRQTGTLVYNYYEGISFEDIDYNTSSDGGDAYSSGGAIYGSTITLSDNGSVTFSGNSAGFGGAIYGSTITLSGNGSVEFIGNTAEFPYSDSYGGAIYGRTIELSGNGSVEFSWNTTSSGVVPDESSPYAYGGAIYGDNIMLSENKEVSFVGNLAHLRLVPSPILLDCLVVGYRGVNRKSCGGAIYGGEDSTIELSGNGSVTFSGNTVSGASSYGGAIYSCGNLSIQNNDSVLFEKNAEVENGTYRLRSIYAGGSGDVISLSAAEGKGIEFRDALYIDFDSTVELNADYTDAEGVIHKQTGDIIFTGKYTEAHLNALLEAAGVGRTATAEEILNSRTTEVQAMTNLYGGRLRVEDGAIYKGRGITVAEGSGASVLVKDASLNHTGYDLTFSAGTTLELHGKNTISGTVKMLAGSTLSFVASADNATSVTSGLGTAVLTMDGALTLPQSGTITLRLSVDGGVVPGDSYALITGVSNLSGWSESTIRVTTDQAGWEVSYDDLSWVGKTLWLYYNSQPDLTIATWTNESGNRLWDADSVNWEQNEYDYAYKDGVQVIFGDEGAGTVTLVGALSPASVSVNSSKDYTWNADATAGETLIGSMKLTKDGSGKLVINTSNSYTGGTEIKGGILVANNARALGSGYVNLNGGTLEIGVSGITNNIKNTGSSTLSTSVGVTHALTGIISNSGTLTFSGAFQTSGLGQLSVRKEATYENADGNEDSTGGFAKTAVQGIQLANGSTVNKNATILHGTVTLALGTDGWATKGGDVAYGSYYLGVNHGAELDDIVAAAAAKGVNSTNIQLKGGILKANAALTGVLTAEGTSEIVADNWTVSTAFTNSGTLSLSGTIDAKNIGVESIGATLIDASGADNLSGFTKDAGSKFALVNLAGNGSIVDPTQVAIDRNGTSYVLGRDGVATAEGTIHYGNYLVGLNKDNSRHEVELDDIIAVAAAKGVDGTNIQLNGGVLTANAALTGVLTSEGTSEIIADNWQLNQIISNSGTLSISGSIDASALELEVTEAGRVSLSGADVSLSESGFTRAAEYSVLLVAGGKTVNEGVSILHDDYRMRSELVLGEDGVARAGGGVDYSRFYLTGADAVSVSEVDAVSEAKGSDLLNVTMDGGELEVDADITVDADGGRISVTKDSTLGGTIDGVEIATAEGDYTSDITAVIGGGSRVTVNGGHICLSGDNAYTGGTVINGGVLSAGSDTAFGTGDIVLNKGELNLNGKAAENALLANGGMIANGGAFRGSVSVNGSVGLRGNMSARSMSINSGSVLTLNGSTISVSGTLTLGGSAVLNLNGSDFGDGDVLITFGSLSGSEKMLTVDYGADSDQYSVEREGNALILAWLEETQPEEEPLPEPEPEMPQPETPAPVLDRESCDALAQSSWGVFTASHAFVSAVQGLHDSTGQVGTAVAWVSALGGVHRIEDTETCSGSDIDLYGAAFGLETQLTETDSIGFALGKVGGEVSLKQGGSQMEQDSIYLSVYGSHLLAEYARNRWLTLRWSAAYGVTDTEGTLGQEDLSLKQDNVQLNARLEWNSQLAEHWTLHAFAGAEYFASGSSETGEEQSVRLGSIQNLRGEIGIGTRYASGSTTVYGEIRYLNDMVRSNPYADINGLRGYGANPGRQGIGVTVGAQQSLGDGWSVNASYSLEAMSEATMHSANIGVGYRF